jgi:hypothetical protein
MGRRRNIGETRSAGAGRVCPHPSKSREYQMAADSSHQYRIRCRRCGQVLLPLDERAPRPPR